MIALNGKFIVFEGIDGCGKGTIISLASNWLFSMDFDNILLTREPTFSGTGAQIRRILRSDQDPSSKAKQMLSLYIEDRKEHLEKVIKPALRLNSVILCDRYKYSTMCYQQEQGISMNKIIELHKTMLVPDLVLILDADASIALNRLAKSGKSTEKFEKKLFLENIRESYLKIPKLLSNENIKVIDANNSIEEVFASAKREIKKELKQKN